MPLKRISEGERRTIEQLSEHYEIEKELANRLKNSTKEDRKKKNLYSTLYDELYQRVPHHPQLTMKADVKAQREAIAAQMKRLSNFLDREYTFLELGPGDCHLSFEVAKYVRKVYAIDVSEEITKNPHQPKNFELILSDGSSVNVPPESIDVAYSNQLMEHLHPDDAIDQLQGIYNALVPGGIYICVTPHRFTGPHDISKYFDDVATGFHLKEYTNKELYRLFKSVGFSKIQSYLGAKGIYVKFPIYPAIIVEYLLEPLLYSVRRKISKALLVRNLFGIHLIATK